MSINKQLELLLDSDIISRHNITIYRYYDEKNIYNKYCLVIKPCYYIQKYINLILSNKYFIIDTNNYIHSLHIDNGNIIVNKLDISIFPLLIAANIRNVKILIVDNTLKNLRIYKNVKRIKGLSESIRVDIYTEKAKCIKLPKGIHNHYKINLIRNEHEIYNIKYFQLKYFKHSIFTVYIDIMRSIEYNEYPENLLSSSAIQYLNCL